ncbi:linear amide C-N hydrolase [Abyssisolibacter fermentans]|uniref:linear amide C-N hydrolase n=1 Tax=Abyssisolibacter fermentans TaxID=1766203 RepID=UPI000831DBB9|nr:C45 family peptidase [Abyssisolibacter fermentans]
MNKKRIVIKGLIILLSVLLIIIIITIGLFLNELKTLSSLEKVDEYPFYTMTYEGDYGFDDFLNIGASSDKDIEKYVIKRLLKGIDIDLNISSAGCTAFTTQNNNGKQIFGRNFDFPYSPPLLLYTKPDNGYASVSLVNLSYVGYDENYLPEPKKLNSFLTLATPYLPFDGMNECGVTMALLAVPYAEPPQKEGQITLNTTTAIRLVLDKACDVNEAVELLKQYNYYFSGGVDCHYLLADSTGKSVIVEFLEGEVKIVDTDTNYQIASNFIAYNGLNIGEGYNEFDRYETIEEHLKNNKGIITVNDAMDLLSEVKIPNKTQWSVVYNLVTKKFVICINEDYETQYVFKFESE